MNIIINNQPIVKMIPRIPGNKKLGILLDYFGKSSFLRDVFDLTLE
jgi:hypothetical protein